MASRHAYAVLGCVMPMRRLKRCRSFPIRPSGVGMTARVRPPWAGAWPGATGSQAQLIWRYASPGAADLAPPVTEFVRFGAAVNAPVPDAAEMELCSADAAGMEPCSRAQQIWSYRQHPPSPSAADPELQTANAANSELQTANAADSELRVPVEAGNSGSAALGTDNSISATLSGETPDPNMR